MSYQSNFQKYLSAVQKPFEKIVRLDFLQADEKSVAFSLGNERARGFMKDYPTNALIQSGSLNVNLQNGTRRTCTVVLDNNDGKFHYAANKLWFGTKVRLMMGLVLPDGTPFYIPQGVFLIKEPQTAYKPNDRTITLSLTDKFAALDGSLGGRLSYAYQIPSTYGSRPKIFEIMQQLLHLSKFTLEETDNPDLYIDPATPKFTNYYNGQTTTVTYTNGETEVIDYDSVSYDLSLDNGSTIAQAFSELNTLIAAWYGYDATGAFFVDPSQDDVDDTQKPILWEFTEQNSEFLGLTETAKTGDLYNNVVVRGNGLHYATYYGRAYDADPISPTNIYKIGLKTFFENASNLCSEKQCKDYAYFLLKRKSLLSTSVSITSGQLFHLRENALVSVRRDDLDGSPTKLYLITAYSLPLADEGEMSITCTGVAEDSRNYTVEGGIS